jgi:hypothetical protein
MVDDVLAKDVAWVRRTLKTDRFLRLCDMPRRPSSSRARRALGSLIERGLIEMRHRKKWYSRISTASA